MQKNIPLEPGKYYHVYTRGNNKENIFLEEKNYDYFLQLFKKYISPIADTFAYCLLRNHFHFLIRINKTVKTEQTSQVLKTCEVSPALASKQFSNLLNAYTKAINITYGRTGSLFQERFKRIEVTSPQYFTKLIYYIHYNPQKHGFIEDFKEWPHSSYHSYLQLNKQSNLQRYEVLNWFGGYTPYQNLHQNGLEDFNGLQNVIGDD